MPVSKNFRPECLLLLLLSSAQSADLLMQEADLSDVISSISISRIKSGGRMLSAGQFCPGFFIWLEIEEKSSTKMFEMWSQ